MKMTTNARDCSKRARDTVLPTVSGKLKPGADVPKGSILEAVTTIIGSLFVN
jgi:hypothetical protein